MSNYHNSQYSYELPESQIGRAPAVPRDASKLFVYNTVTGEITHTTFRHIAKFLPADSLLFLNNTKVLPVRCHGIRYTGKVIEILVMPNIVKNDEFIYATCSKKLLQNEYITLLDSSGVMTELSLHAVNCEEKVFQLTLKKNTAHLPCDPYTKDSDTIQFETLHPDMLIQFLKKNGKTPLPGYITDCPLTEEKSRHKYQTIFAKNQTLNRHTYGSSAAPTASLHFTNRVFKNLSEKGIKKYFLTHHIGLGTFAPVLPEYIEQKKLFDEYYMIPEQTVQALNDAKKNRVKITAVGTTAVRAIESYGLNHKVSGSTDIFIMPPFEFKFITQLVTNFHLPNTSLMMLVESFLHHKNAKHSLVELYEIAKRENYRFYSFGDAMLIL